MPLSLSWEACSSTNHPLSEEHFPNIQCELPMTQLQAVSLYPIAGHQGVKIRIFPFTPSCEEVVDRLREVIVPL